MSYANPLMLVGLIGILIPIIIHLITQHRAKKVDWGAMCFLTESVVHRSRRTLLEQILLLMSRCLLVGLVSMALALPFVRPDSRIPWPFVLPAVLLGTLALGAATAVAKYRLWRWGLIAAGSLLLSVAALASFTEQWLGMGNVLKPAAAVDVVIIVDGSDSMNLAVNGVTNFQAAVSEANAIVSALRPGDAASIVLAGAQMQSKPTAPSRRPEELRKILSELSVVGGTMSARDALSAAAGICSRGDNASKKIIVITDGQNAGWMADGKVDWQQIVEPLKQLTVPPALMLRKLPLPKRINNVQIADIKTAEGVMGPDREQAVQVRVENTGTVPVTDPFDVELIVNNDPNPLRLPVARMEPGVAQLLTFHLRPSRGGLHSVVARIARADDMPWDNSFSRVIRGFERIPILLVDGNPTGRVRDRATWFLDLALSPEMDASVKSTAAGESAAEPAGLYRVTTVDFSKLTTVGDLRQFRVVVLADVPKLTTTAAVEVADFVAEGGGLLVSLGSRCQPSFYNTWQARGVPLMPATLTTRRVSDSEQPAVHPQIGSFKHDALRIVGENPQTDIGTATITAYWQLKAAPGDEGVHTWAALSSGDPWMMERRIGRGRVLVSTVALDRTASDLPALQSFLPLMHEIVGHLIQLPVGGSELALGDKHAVELRTADAGRARTARQAEAPPTGGAANQQGLRADYFAGADFRNLHLSRVDPNIAFQWPASPIERLTDPAFSVRWTGTLVPPATDSYTFTLEGDSTRLWINGKLVAATVPPAAPPASSPPVAAAPAPAAQPAVSQSLELSGGKAYAIRLEHVGKTGQGKCELFWQGKQLPRQAIPATCLVPSVAWRAELAGSPKPALLATPGGELWGPAGSQKTPVLITPHDDGATVYINALLKPGLYSLQLPEAMRDEFQELLVEDRVPVAVRPQPLESQLSVLADGDMTSAAGHVPLLVAASVDEVVAQLSGQSAAGQRLWRYLAVAALLLAVAEIALARWISVQRMVGHEPIVKFSSELSPAGVLASSAFDRFAANKRPPAVTKSTASL